MSGAEVAAPWVRTPAAPSWSGPARYEERFYELIEASEAQDPRSLQKVIGPSGLGTDCIHCLACGIFQIPKAPDGRRIFKQWVGRQCHAGMEGILHAHNKAQGRTVYHPERRVHVGDIGPIRIEGTADCFDEEYGVVVDWKFPGDYTIQKARKGIIAPGYRRQPHLYGHGYENAGYTVNGVMVLFLGVTGATAREAVPYKADYDRGLADETMDRANRLYDLVISDGGPEQVIPKLRRDPDCFDCPRFAL